MPIVPTYKQQERWQIPSVDKNVSDPIHLKETYQNNISRTGELLSQAQTYWFGNDKKEKRIHKMLQDKTTPDKTHHPQTQGAPKAVATARCLKHQMRRRKQFRKSWMN